MSIPEATGLVGLRIAALPPLVYKVGIETERRSGRTMTPVAALDRLRDYSASR